MQHTNLKRKKKKSTVLHHKPTEDEYAAGAMVVAEALQSATFTINGPKNVYEGEVVVFVLAYKISCDLLVQVHLSNPAVASSSAATILLRNSKSGTAQIKLDVLSSGDCTLQLCYQLVELATKEFRCKEKASLEVQGDLPVVAKLHTTQILLKMNSGIGRVRFTVAPVDEVTITPLKFELEPDERVRLVITPKANSANTITLQITSATILSTTVNLEVREQGVRFVNNLPSVVEVVGNFNNWDFSNPHICALNSTTSILTPPVRVEWLYIVDKHITQSNLTNVDLQHYSFAEPTLGTFFTEIIDIPQRQQEQVTEPEPPAEMTLLSLYNMLDQRITQLGNRLESKINHVAEISSHSWIMSHPLIKQLKIVQLIPPHTTTNVGTYTSILRSNDHYRRLYHTHYQDRFNPQCLHGCMCMICWYSVQQLWNEIEFDVVGIDTKKNQTVVAEVTTAQVTDNIVTKKLLQMERQELTTCKHTNF